MQRDRYGLTDEEFQSVFEHDGLRPFRRYRNHREGARRRGIGFELTFRQWWDVWTASGRYRHMGTRRGHYVMARLGDTGPYALGNVEIQPIERNSQDAQRRRRLGRMGTRHEAIRDFDDPVMEELEGYCIRGSAGA